MLKIYKIDAVHPVAKRIVKYNLKPDEMTRLYKELQNSGYEDKDILVDVQKEIYEEGDTVIISEKIFDASHDDAKETIKYLFGKNPEFPIIGKLERNRINRDLVILSVKWYQSRIGSTNTHLLEQLGFEFKEPIFKVLPIDECPDELLDAHDLVIKYMMLRNEWTKDEVDKHLKPVYDAMKDAEAVFYRP